MSIGHGGLSILLHHEFWIVVCFFCALVVSFMQHTSFSPLLPLPNSLHFWPVLSPWVILLSQIIWFKLRETMASTLWWVSVSDVDDCWLFCACTISLSIWGVVGHHASGCSWDGWMLHGSCIVVDWPSFHFICLNFTSLTFVSLLIFNMDFRKFNWVPQPHSKSPPFIWQLISVHTKVPTLLLFHILPCYTIDQHDTM